MRKTPEPLTGTLRVGPPVTPSCDIVMPKLAGFLRPHPQVRVELRSMMQLKDMPAEGVDMLIRVGEPPVTDLVARKIGQIRLDVSAGFFDLCHVPPERIVSSQGAGIPEVRRGGLC